MAEVQTSTQSGELTQRFVEFVLMQAQNAALFLGQIPNPQTGKTELNLDLAKMFIDQLDMIRQKTRGNLSGDEQSVLNNAISNLQIAFVDASQKSQGTPVSQPPAVEAVAMPEASSDTDKESKKKFTKSYGR